jgi:predicted HTH transcriptional regulator
VLRRFGLAEDSGQGIDVIEDNMRMELLAEPVFDAAPDSFAVHLPLTGLVSTTERGWLAEFERAGQLRADERILLLTVAREERVTNARARDVLESTAPRHVRGSSDCGTPASSFSTGRGEGRTTASAPWARIAPTSRWSLNSRRASR